MVHSASGHAGQVNQASSRTRSHAPAGERLEPLARMPQAPSTLASATASTVLAAIHGMKRRAGSYDDALQITPPTTPSASAMLGAPLAARAGSAASTASFDSMLRNGLAASA